MRSSNDNSPTSACGTSRTSGDVRPESAKWANRTLIGNIGAAIASARAHWRACSPSQDINGNEQTKPVEQTIFAQVAGNSTGGGLPDPRAPIPHSSDKLDDMVAYEPNWPKHFLMTHAIELAITAYLIFERGLNEARRGKWPEAHDLEALYEEAARRGLESNQLVLKDLSYLSELHKVHYARYPKIEVKGVPAHISEYRHILDHLFADIEKAIGLLGRASNRHF
jgi:hypothetical protein